VKPQATSEPVATAAAIVGELRALRNERNIEGQRRYGIATTNCELLGVTAPVLREIARRHRRDHALALALWEQPVHEARIVAALVDDPRQVTRRQMEAWAAAFDTWALVDGCCCHLFDRTAFAIEKAHAWSRRRGEYVKRAGFVLMAGLAVHAKKLPDEVFLEFLPVVRREAGDGRNFVKKAVNWALRQIGKRNPALRRAAIAEAECVLALGEPSARWIARDALRELRTRGA
jgi:3-methyladenine DNA glycosylase AlkD